MPSERKAYESQIRELKGRIDTIHACALRSVTRTIVECEFLSLEDKIKLQELLWREFK